MNLAERIVFWAMAGGLFVLAGTYFFSHTYSPALPTSWDYKDVVSILLSVVTVALTVLGIIIAIRIHLHLHQQAHFGGGAGDIYENDEEWVD